MNAQINRSRLTRPCSACEKDILKGSPKVTVVRKKSPRLHYHPDCWVEEGLKKQKISHEIKRIDPEIKDERNKVLKHLAVCRHRLKKLREKPATRYTQLRIEKLELDIELLNRQLSEKLGGIPKPPDETFAEIMEFQGAAV